MHVRLRECAVVQPVDAEVEGTNDLPTPLRIPRLVLYLIVGIVIAVQSLPAHPYQYLSPRPNATLVNPRTSIVVRPGEEIDRTSLRRDLVYVVGSASGEHRGTLRLSDDKKTVVFIPSDPFRAGETVHIRISDGVRTRGGTQIPRFAFSFRISPLPAIPVRSRPSEAPRGGESTVSLPLRQQRSLQSVQSIRDSTLPHDFPAIRIVKNDTSHGDPIFLGTFDWGTREATPYLLILERNGLPIFYRRLVEGWDFKLQPTGVLTYFDVSLGEFVAVDSSYRVVDRYMCGNGYNTDQHELRLLPDNHAYLLSYEIQTVNMDSIVPGGNPYAQVTGLIIQEIDRNKDVVFEWRSWDHFAITDAVNEEFTSPEIDYVHGNAIDFDADGNLLLSSRNMDEITKIDRNTGEIIWRLGGKHNQFRIINDPELFQHQHAIRRLPNGNITMFDNGVYREGSRAVEYALDQDSLIATRIWEYRPSPAIFGWALGFTQRLPSGNTLIGWGSANPTVTEVTRTGEKVFELDLPENIFSYRVFSFPWKTNAFVPASNSVQFPGVALRDSTSYMLVVTNPTDSSILLTSFRTRTDAFTVTNPAPLILPPHDSVHLRIRYTPASVGPTFDTLAICSEDSVQGIIQRVSLFGSSSDNGLSTSVETLTFSPVAQGDTSTLPITVWNALASPVTITVASLSSGMFNVLLTTPAIVPPLDSIVVVVQFTPTSIGSFRDSLILRSSSGVRTIVVNGTGREPTTGLRAAGEPVPSAFALSQNYPNPFNPTTEVTISVPVASMISFKIYDIVGREAAALIDGPLSPGYHGVSWDARGMPSGVYFCRITATPLEGTGVGIFRAARKVLLLK